MKFIPRLLCSLLAYFSMGTLADWSDSFVEGVNSYTASGELTFVSSSTLSNAPSNRKLPANIVNDPATACDSNNGRGTCRARDSNPPLAVKPEGIPLFEECRTTSNDNIAPGWNENVSLPAGEYGDVTINVSGNFKFADDGGVYRIKHLNVNNGTVEFAAGQYWVERLTLNYGTNIILPSSGSVVFFIEQNYLHTGNVVGDASNPERLVFYSYGDFVQNGGTTLNAYAFSEQSASLDGNSTLNGAITGDGVLLNGQSEVLFQDRADQINVVPDCGTAAEPLLLQFGNSGAGQNGGTVTFDQAYQSKPLVFLMTPMDASDPNNDGPVAAILTSVIQNNGEWTGFTWARQEPPGNSTPSKNIQAIDWIAVNEGEHFLEDGTELRAGTIDTNAAFPFPDRGYFNVAMPSNLSVVLHQMQSRSNNCWLTSNSEYNNNGIRLAIDSSEAYDFRFFSRYCVSDNDSIYYEDLQDETVAYLATEATVGAITVDNQVVNYQFGNSVTHGSGGSTLTPAATCNYTTSYQTNLFSVPPILVGSKNERRGNNGGWLRRCQHNTADFSMITEEDQYLDNERTHLAEEYSYMAFASNSSVQVPGLNIFADSPGLTCDIHEVTIQAVLRDESGDEIDQNFQGTVGLSTSTNRGTWSQGNGQGSLQAGADNGQASYTFVPNDLGQVTLGLLHPLEGAVTLTVADGTVSATTIVTFNAYGFKDELIGTWGENPHKANTEFALKLTAVGKDPDGGVGCSQIANYEGTKDLSFWTDYSQPASGSRQLAVQDQVSNVFVDVSASQSANTKIKTVFSGGEAQLNLRYPDVGRLSINFWDEVGSVIDGSTTTLLGSTTAELIPAGFVWQDIKNQTDETRVNPSSYFTKAGDPFVSSLVAVIDNCDISTQGQECHALNFVADFANNPENLLQEASLESPADGEEGTLSKGSVDSQSAGVVLIIDTNYSEVGSINYTGGVAEYLGYTLVDHDVAEANEVVGSFYPHHFELTVASIQAACLVGDFTYIGQQEQLISWTLIAENAFGVTTQNYSTDKNFPVTEVGREPANDWRFVSSSPIAGFDDDFNIEESTSTWVDGVFTETDLLSGVEKPVTAQAPVVDGAISLFYQYDDAGIQSTNGIYVCAGDDDTAYSCVLGTAPSLRHGRIKLNNGFGSELQAISVNGELQYYDGSQYIRNVDDTCSNLNLANLEFVPKIDATTAQVGGGSSTVSLRSPGVANQGIIWVDFSAPGEGNTGQVDYWFDLESNLNWLREDWNGNGSFENADDAAGSGQVTFGIFRQSDRVIDRRML
ncbi:DUF6701 domain-containing protein [Agarivorans sp. Alg241-V36]|uniref:DUF6701 domain-containing protein n=1 Tax=Agarivorans sp. Alg241-V36 TaxID=2305992 RepID=UPI0013D242D5|nr:DUF6701 domain-containing protein [Agarivorans sp. Alg241-V36]